MMVIGQIRIRTKREQVKPARKRIKPKYKEYMEIDLRTIPRVRVVRDVGFVSSWYKFVREEGGSVVLALIDQIGLTTRWQYRVTKKDFEEHYEQVGENYRLRNRFYAFAPQEPFRDINAWGGKVCDFPSGWVIVQGYTGAHKVCLRSMFESRFREDV